MTALHVFDMDGTLMRGSSASLEIARRIGALDAVRTHEAESAAGRLTNLGFAQGCHPLWQVLTDSDIDEAFRSAPWIDGVREVLADIAERGERSAVISMSPLFFVRRLLDWGADTVHATDIAIGGLLDPRLVLTAESKVDITSSLLDEYGLSPRDCVAYGDSRSDEALFRFLPSAVAVNGDGHVRSLAQASYDGDDLRTAYERGRALLDRSREEGAWHA